MASVSRMRSNEPIEISSDETNDSDENDDQLDRENDSFGKFQWEQICGFYKQNLL